MRRGYQLASAGGSAVMSDVVVFWCRVSVEREAWDLGWTSRMVRRVRRSDGQTGHGRVDQDWEVMRARLPSAGRPSCSLDLSLSGLLVFWNGIGEFARWTQGLVVASGGSDGAPVLKTLLAAVRFVVVRDSRCTSLFVCFYDIPTARVRLVRSRNSIFPISSLSACLLLLVCNPTIAA